MTALEEKLKIIEENIEKVYQAGQNNKKNTWSAFEEEED